MLTRYSLIISLVMVCGPAFSQSREAEACQDDAVKFCSDDIPDTDRITACMVRQKANLSPGCQAMFPKAYPRPKAAGTNGHHLKYGGGHMVNGRWVKWRVR